MVYLLLCNSRILCKCKHKWTNWDAKQGKEGPIPKTCPSCRNIRWNQYYTEDDKAVFEQLEDQHLAGKPYNGRDDDYADSIYPFDFIAYDFLYEMKPQPDMFEIKRVLAIPPSDIEARHELMLEIIQDRISNKAKGVYDNGVIGVGNSSYTYRYMNDKRDAAEEHYIDSYSKYFRQKRCVMKGCKHGEIPEIKHVLYPDINLQAWDKWLKLEEEHPQKYLITKNKKQSNS